MILGTCELKLMNKKPVVKDEDKIGKTNELELKDIKTVWMPPKIVGKQVSHGDEKELQTDA